MEKLLKQYKALNTVLSEDEERDMVYRYVYATNKLEGNKLSLAQTVDLLSNNVISGDNISIRDILETKGMQKAVYRMFKAVRNKEVLSTELMLELNWLAIGSYFLSDEAYLTAKNKGQKYGAFKMAENKIVISGVNAQEIIPESNVDNAEANMELLVKQINLSEKSSIDRAAFLALNVWIHQPFIDGNKRISRLLINFLTMSEGFPFFTYENQGLNFNSLMVDDRMNPGKNLVKNFISLMLKIAMEKEIKNQEKARRNKGLGGLSLSLIL